MEKIKFAFADGSGEAEFFVLEQTKIGGFVYILVTDSQKEVTEGRTAESVYEIVEEDTELLAVSKVFEELLEDVNIEM